MFKIIEIKKQNYLNYNNEIDKCFGRLVIHQIIGADNQPFNNHDFKQSGNDCNLQIENACPSYSKSNSLSEKSVEIAKVMMKKSKQINNQDIERYLLNYRNLTGTLHAIKTAKQQNYQDKRPVPTI